ncbi:MAG TPA: hypothetical protein VJZ04_03795 [Lachnospiraceae bacterium]|nr:hypothetical protein [Lachnospiraceae bacterium]
MKFYKYLYIGVGAKKNIGKIRFKLKTHIGQLNVYIIILSEGSNLLETFDSAFLKQSYYRKKPITIAGIAKGKTEALDLIKTMIEDCYKTTGNCNIKEQIINNIDFSTR